MTILQLSKNARIIVYIQAQKAFNKIITGFFFHLLGQIVLATLRNQILQAIICIIGWYFIINGFIHIKKIGFKLPFNGIYKYIFFVYISLCIIMIIRGYLIDYPYQWISWQGLINFHFFSPTYILPYLMPLIAFIPSQYYDFRPFIKCSVIVACISIILFVLYFRDIIYASKMSAIGYSDFYSFGATMAHIYIPVGFAVLCQRFIPNKLWMTNLMALIATLLIYAVAARRGSTITTAMLFLFNIYFFVKRKSQAAKFISIVLSVFVIIGAFYFFMSSDLFSFIHQRGLEDSRSGVDKALLEQMDSWELIFGKGLNGRYYYPLSSDDYLGGWRYGSETGFYNIVLKGGYLMAIFYIVILLYPALLGIFKSKNTLCKALGFYIILSLIKLYPFGWLSFNLEFLIIWMGVAMCQNQHILQMNDWQIYKYFFKEVTFSKNNPHIKLLE